MDDDQADEDQGDYGQADGDHTGDEADGDHADDEADDDQTDNASVATSNQLAESETNGSEDPRADVDDEMSPETYEQLR